MTEEESKRFNFLEAAARIYLSHVSGKNEPCVFPGIPPYRRTPDDTTYLVRYKQGNLFIKANIGPKLVLFKQMKGHNKNLSRIDISTIMKYLETRSTVQPPPVTLR